MLVAVLRKRCLVVNGEPGSLDEWLYRANQDCAQSIAADADIERSFSFVTFIAGVRCEALSASAKSSLARPVIEAYESIDRSTQLTNSKDVVAGVEKVHVSHARVPQDQWDVLHA